MLLVYSIASGRLVAAGAFALGKSNGHYVKIQASRKQWMGVLVGARSEKQYPTVWTIKGEDGYLIDAQTGRYIRARERPNAAFGADPEGWMYPESPAKRVTGPAPKASGSYVEMHPTNFRWRRDVADLVRSVEAQYLIFANTYYQHPPDWNRDETSVDFWGPEGRGDPINPLTGDAIVNRILNDPNPPNVAWLIWAGYIFIRDQGWQPFVDDGTGLHYDHVHLTCV